MAKIIQRISYSSLLALAFGVPAQSQEWQFQPRVDAGFIYYEFEQDSITVSSSLTEEQVDDDGIVTVTNGVRTESSNSVSFNDTMPFVGLGGTVFYDRFFIDLYARKAFSGNDTTSLNQTLSTDISATATAPDGSSAIATLDTTITTPSELDVDFEREDFSISLGYAVSDRFVIYGGYRIGKTELNQRETATAFYLEESSLATFLPDGTPVPELTSSSSFNFTLRGKGRTNSEFRQRGPFIGATYGIPVGNLGTFTANLGVAFLSGELDVSTKLDADSFEIIDPSLEIIDEALLGEVIAESGLASRLDLDGDVIGLTLGFSWSGRLSERLSYTVNVSGYQFNYDADEDNSPDFSETTVNTSVGLVYLF